LSDPALLGVLAGCAIILLATLAGGIMPRLFAPAIVLGVLISWNLWILASAVTLVSCGISDQQCALWAGNPSPAYALLHVFGGIAAGLAAVWPQRRPNDPPPASPGTKEKRTAPNF